MTLFERWCEAGWQPDVFWTQTPRLVRYALKGYQERVNKAVLLAGGKPAKKQVQASAKQTPDQMAGIMQSWVSATMGKAGALTR